MSDGEKKYSVEEVTRVLHIAEEAGWINEIQVAQLAGLFIAEAMAERITEIEASAS